MIYLFVFTVLRHTMLQLLLESWKDTVLAKYNYQKIRFHDAMILHLLEVQLWLPVSNTSTYLQIVL